MDKQLTPADRDYYERELATLERNLGHVPPDRQAATLAHIAHLKKLLGL
jgi:hypothetical protein